MALITSVAKHIIWMMVVWVDAAVHCCVCVTMEGSWGSGRGEDGESVTEEPDEAWVAEHLKVTRLDDEHGGGVAVRVKSLAWEGAEADVDVAKTGAWLQAHGGEVKAFRALMSAC